LIGATPKKWSLFQLTFQKRTIVKRACFHCLRPQKRRVEKPPKHVYMRFRVKDWWISRKAVYFIATFSIKRNNNCPRVLKTSRQMGHVTY
jgi:hypothetical protein